MALFSPDVNDAQAKLELLRRLDPLGQWLSLDDTRCCTVCRSLIRGRDIEVVSNPTVSEPLRLQCPTPGCRATPRDWEAPPACQERTTAEFDFFFPEEVSASPAY